MRRLFSCACLAATMLTAVVVVAPTVPARAQDLELRIGPGGVTPRYRDDRGRRGDRERWRHRERHGCDPAEAEDVARHYGLRHARVVRMTPRSVIVEGWTRDGRTRMRFRNMRGCPAD